MKKAVKRVWFCFLLAALVWCGTLFADRQMLREELIRLHVVAASDSQEDQMLKLRVRDAVVESLESGLAGIGDVEQAKLWLRENLGKLEAVANGVLRAAGCGDSVEVSLTEEAFTARYSDTVSLPSGVYQALRITIGDGKGENWWCVVFPACWPNAAAGEFKVVATGTGLPEGLSVTLCSEEDYGIRFYLLDALGKLENWLFAE